MVIGPTALLPVSCCVPLHPSEAAQLVALELVHMRVSVPTIATIAEVAVKAMTGIGKGCVTVTLTEPEPVPPAPVQDRENVEFFSTPATVCVPALALDPDQPPDPVQLVAWVEDQVSATAPPATMLEDWAEIDTVGAGGGVLDSSRPQHPAKAAVSNKIPTSGRRESRPIATHPSMFSPVLDPAP